jgi:phospholipase C
MLSGARCFLSRFAVPVVLAIGIALPLIWVAGCGHSAPGARPGPGSGADAGADADVAGPDAEAEATAPPIPRTQGEGVLAPERQACAFDAGAWAAQTIGTEYPVGADIPINHVVVIMQENRSFDHYLGRLVAQGYYKSGDFSPGDDAGAPRGSGFSHHDEVDGPPPGWSNQDGDGGLVVPHPDNEYCFGVDHSWQGMHNDYDNGRLDRFVIQNDPDGERTFFYEDDTVIPFYYALASTFAVGDRYYCSVLTSTWPNRLFLMAATSFGIGDNSFVTIDKADHPAPQLFTNLEAAGRTWKDYTDGPHQVAFFPNFGLQRSTIAHYANVKCNLFHDIQGGTLPDVSLVMGDEVDESSDEGPSDLPGIGGGLVESIVRALFASPSWKDTALFIVYDENGGMADHVPPAPACPPDGYAPHDVNGAVLPGAFDTTGFRVPMVVVSPYARAHFASHTVYDHTSITRFIEARFGLPALSARDANATPPYEMFDFQHPPFVTPPTIAAHTTVPAGTLTKCGQSLPPACPN